MDHSKPELYNSSSYDQLQPAEQVFVDAHISKIQNVKKETVSSAVLLDGKEVMIPYSIDARGKAMLRKPLVQAAILERRRHVSEKLEIRAETVLNEVAAVAFSNVASFINIKQDGGFEFNLSKATMVQLSAIQELICDNGKIKIKMHNKNDAIEKLMKYLQLYAPERVELIGEILTKKININMTIDEAAALYAHSLKNKND